MWDKGAIVVAAVLTNTLALLPYLGAPCTGRRGHAMLGDHAAMALLCSTLPCVQCSYLLPDQIRPRDDGGRHDRGKPTSEVVP